MQKNNNRRKNKIKSDRKYNEVQCHISIKHKMIEVPWIYNQRLHYPLQCILTYLNVKDLHMLSCTSKKLNQDVETFFKVLCKSLSLDRAIKTIISQQLALEKDQLILNILKNKNYFHKWLFMKWTKVRRVYRKPVADFHIIPTENPWHIKKEIDSILNREVVNIVKLRWMYFAHKFFDILPGTYKAVLHLNISNVSWLDRYASAKISTYWEDSNGFHEMKSEKKIIEWQDWSDTLNKITLGNCISLQGEYLLNYDIQSGWFDLCSDNFTLDETADVTFEFKDAFNFLWVSGICLDYVELKPLDWMSYHLIDEYN